MMGDSSAVLESPDMSASCGWEECNAQSLIDSLLPVRMTDVNNLGCEKKKKVRQKEIWSSLQYTSDSISKEG